MEAAVVKMGLQGSLIYRKRVTMISMGLIHHCMLLTSGIELAVRVVAARPCNPLPYDHD